MRKIDIQKGVPSFTLILVTLWTSFKKNRGEVDRIRPPQGGRGLDHGYTGHAIMNFKNFDFKNFETAFLCDDKYVLHIFNSTHHFTMICN